jgi:exodeoxyribonuclease VII large subunit
LAVPVRIELLAWLDQQGARMTTSLSGGLQRRSQRLRDLSRALPRLETLLDGPRQRLDTTSARLGPALMSGVQRRKVRLADAAGGLRPAAMQRMIENERRRLNGLSARFDVGLVQDKIETRRDSVDAIVQRIKDAGEQRVTTARNKIEAMDRLRLTLGYEATLTRGYAVVRGDGDVVTTKKAAGKAQALEIQFADGRLVVGAKAASARKAPPKPTDPGPTDQGSLF